MATTIDPQEAAETDRMFEQLVSERAIHGSAADEAAYWAAEAASFAKLTPTVIWLDAESFDKMVAELDAPLRPKPKLKKLFDRPTPFAE